MEKLGTVSKADDRNEDYQKELALSNSFLSGYEAILEGKNKNTHFFLPALKRGAEVHRRFLEPGQEKRYELGTVAEGKCVTMIGGLQSCQSLVNFRNEDDTKVESVQVGMINGIPFKGILDIYNEQMGIIADIKTTSASNVKQFMENIIKFNYFSQAYIYLQITGARQFIIYGVNHAGETFTISLTEPRYKIHMNQAEHRVDMLAEAYVLERGKFWL